jgi:hypothetical protein
VTLLEERTARLATWHNRLAAEVRMVGAIIEASQGKPLSEVAQMLLTKQLERLVTDVAELSHFEGGCNG